MESKEKELNVRSIKIIDDLGDTDLNTVKVLETPESVSGTAGKVWECVRLFYSCGE